MGQTKNTREWVRAWKGWSLNVEGAFSLSNARYSLARYVDSRRLFEVYAFFNTEDNFNERLVSRRLGKRLKELFNAERYICVTENCTGKRIDRTFMRLEFYAICDMPDPKKVSQLHSVVEEYA